MIPYGVILNAVKSFQKKYSRCISDCGEKFNMSLLEAEIILFLYNNPEFDTARDICERRMFAKSNVSRAVDSLVGAGILSCRIEKHDRRITHLSITSKADDAVKELRRVQSEFFKKMISGICGDEIKAFRKIILSITENLEMM